MSKLIDFLTFKDNRAARPAAEPARDPGLLRKDEKDAAALTGKYPTSFADIESISEYRLSSLMQYPHY